MYDEISRGNLLSCGFGAYERVYRPYTGFRCRFFRVLSISREREKAYGRENRQYGDDDDQLRDGKGFEDLPYFHRTIQIRLFQQIIQFGHASNVICRYSIALSR